MSPWAQKGIFHEDALASFPVFRSPSPLRAEAFDRVRHAQTYRQSEGSPKHSLHRLMSEREAFQFHPFEFHPKYSETKCWHRKRKDWSVSLRRYFHGWYRPTKPDILLLLELWPGPGTKHELQ